jgi:DNA-binding transcriptional LysR family regulator
LLKEGRRLLLAANELEGQVKRIATGWESELRIAVDTAIPINNLLPLMADFYVEQTPVTPGEPAVHNKGTQLRLQEEVLGGTWDALVSNRVDLIIGGSGDTPGGAGYSHFTLGEFNMVFAVAPEHPLATADEPLSSTEILKHRAIAIADSSRYLPPRSSGLLTGQEVLTVPNMASKLEAHIQGLGVGYLPQHWAQPAIDAQRLCAKTVEATPNRATLQVAWRSDNQGKALNWFVQRLKQPDIQEHLFNCR